MVFDVIECARLRHLCYVFTGDIFGYRVQKQGLIASDYSVAILPLGIYHRTDLIADFN